MSDRYEELSEDIQSIFMSIYNNKSFPMTVGFKFVNDSKLKQVIKIQKFSDINSFLVEKDILVLINDSLYDKLSSDEEMVSILFEQEIDKIGFNPKGSIVMNRPDIVTFSPLIAKYGADKILQANQVDVLSSEQQEDMETNFL
tara:strand:+ start:44468 stop:44896 length:429 start_codon:yes stop_codon:yes gene_type:complete